MITASPVPPLRPLSEGGRGRSDTKLSGDMIETSACIPGPPAPAFSFGKFFLTYSVVTFRMEGREVTRVRIRKRIDEPRNVSLRMRVSRSERDRLGELAAVHGVSVSAYLIGLALGDGSADVGGGKPDPAQVTFRGF